MLEYHYTGKLPRHKNAKYKPSRLPMHGFSFLLNPAPILSLRDIDIGYVIQYIKLAGRRDYALFTFNKVLYLDLSYFPDLNREAIRSNPLLKIIDQKLYFKFEELWAKQQNTN